MARPPRGLGAEDLTMLGGISSQRIDASFNSFTSRIIHQEHLSRMYAGGGNPGASPRADAVRSFRSEASSNLAEGKTYSGERDHYVQSSERDFGTTNNGILGAVERQEISVDVNGTSPVNTLISTSVRVPEWDRSEQAGRLGGEQGYRDVEGRDGDSSESSSGGSDEEEDDGDMDGEGEDPEEVTGFVDDGMSGHKVYENLSTVQIDAVDGRHESVAGPMLVGHAEDNPAQNGTMIVASGLVTSSGYFRDSLATKETSASTDTYGKDGQNFEPGIHASSMHEATQVGPTITEAEDYRGSHHLQSPASVPHADPGNQIVAFNQRRSHEPMEMPLRSALTDPLTGALMDDATILSCGHSFGSDSLQRVLENNACISCGAAARREDMAPNHALRLVVQAYRRELETWKDNSSKSAKRRRERLEQGRLSSGELVSLEVSKLRGVQFPYKVNDKVLIKGNKRTPERFVGRNAVITTQCLNGWYVVRTLDNGESVKLQYRSLMKMDGQPPSIELQGKAVGPNWL